MNYFELFQFFSNQIQTNKKLVNIASLLHFLVCIFYLYIFISNISNIFNYDDSYSIILIGLFDVISFLFLTITMFFKLFNLYNIMFGFYCLRISICLRNMNFYSFTLSKSTDLNLFIISNLGLLSGSAVIFLSIFSMLKKKLPEQ